MGICFNIASFFTSICLTFLTFGFVFSFKKKDYLECCVAVLIGVSLMSLVVCVRYIFPKLNESGLL